MVENYVMVKCALSVLRNLKCSTYVVWYIDGVSTSIVIYTRTIFVMTIPELPTYSTVRFSSEGFLKEYRLISNTYVGILESQTQVYQCSMYHYATRQPRNCLLPVQQCAQFKNNLQTGINCPIIARVVEIFPEVGQISKTYYCSQSHNGFVKLYHYFEISHRNFQYVHCPDMWNCAEWVWTTYFAWSNILFTNLLSFHTPSILWSI